MTPTILPADRLARVMALLSARPAGATPGLSGPDRRLVEAVLGSACLGPVARDEYLSALAAAAAERSLGADTGLDDQVAWEDLLRDGLPGLSDRHLLTLAASPGAIRELNDRVDAALRDGTMAEVWWSHYEIPPAADRPDSLLNPDVQETVELYRRLHAGWSGRAEPSRPPGVAAPGRIPLTRERPPLHMAAADESELVRFLAPDGSVLEVCQSHRPGLSELCLLTPPPDADVELFVDGVPVQFVTPFDRNGLATAHTTAVTPALLGQARLELRLRPAHSGQTPSSPPEDVP